MHVFLSHRFILGWLMFVSYLVIFIIICHFICYKKIKDYNEKLYSCQRV
jgi:hypothetical protein